MVALFIDIILSNPWIIGVTLAMIAVLSYIMANITMRKINTRLIYHKSGNAVDVLSCRETEDRIIFRTRKDKLTKKQQEITITKVAFPEMQVTGLKTFRMFHAVEGYGNTVDIRDIAKQDPRKSGSPASTALSAMATAFELMQRSMGKTRGEYTMLIVGLVCAFLAGFGWGGFIA